MHGTDYVERNTKGASTETVFPSRRLKKLAMLPSRYDRGGADKTLKAETSTSEDHPIRWDEGGEREA